ncbi:GAF domain-containing protein [Mesorhizobium waimense]|uniref:GAF domain-containing protein n=1 Tax=Mesorhizobium waimense TaxID=1300307 RepID=UPI00142E2A2F|nr:GAF domain-containing protein [Mesorhizobium waimense]
MHKSNSERESKIALLTQQLDETREHQAATAEVLKVISRSAFDLDTVLTTLIQTSIQLCQATRGVIWLRRGEQLFLAAQVNYSDEWVAAVRDNPLTPAADAQTTSGLAAFTGEIVHVEDVPNDPRFRSLAAHELGDYRAGLAVPLKRDSKVVGVISLSRPEARLFTVRQIALVQTFADQAVIAIENVRLFEKVEGHNRELAESLDQQTATAEVLKTISSSAFDLDSVLHTLVKSASDLCHSGMGYIYLRQGEVLQPTVQIGWSQEFQEHMNNLPVTPGRGSIAARVAQSGSVEQIADVLDDPEYTNIEGQRLGGFRTLLGVPLMRDGAVTGVFVLARSSVSPFSTREIELVQTFSDQAVIAIENVRLFEEVESRNRDLAESLEQQMATGEILRAISRSPTDAQPVFDTIAQSAAKLCGAQFCFVDRFDGTLLHFMAHYGVPPEAIETIDRSFPMAPGRGSAAARAVSSGTVVQIPDIQADPDYQADPDHKMGALADFLHSRSTVAVPMLKDGVPIGVMTVDRLEAGDFPDRQVELLKTFADQAVIAIENVRLFEEVESRGRDLTDALEKQTATGAILQVIAGSPTDIQPVLDAVAESAARLCDAYDATIYLLRSDRLAVGAHHGPIPIDGTGLPVARDIVTGRAVLDRVPVHVHDLTIAGEEFATGRMMAQRLGFRAILATPLLQEGKAIGALMIRRIEARLFSDNQIDLLKTFANQAVIAIGNVRLFEAVQARTAELSESLQQQTATADVLKVISRSTFDLQAVLDTLTQSAAQLCEADMAGITRQEAEGFYYATNYNLSSDWQEYVKDKRLAPGRGTVVGRALLDRKIVHVADVLADPEYTFLESTSKVWFRTVLGVPLMREGNPIGVLVLARQKVQPFTEKQIDLIQTFADQAVIAIENARLFEEVQARTAELSESLQQQTATADVLKAISRSTFDLRAVLDALAESVTRLCEADNASIVRETDGKFVEAASYGYPAELEEYFSGFVHVPGRGTGVGRVLLEGKAVQIPDVLADADYTLWEGQRLGGYRTVLAVPLLREGVPIGVFSLTRSTVRPFTERQIELVETFADQAVIAIENVRLFDEVQARTAELGEALQQQTATADVLKAISRSTFDLQPVLDTLVDSAAKLCDASQCVIYLREGDMLRAGATFGANPQEASIIRNQLLAFDRKTISGRVALSGRVQNNPDVLSDPEYDFPTLDEHGTVRAALGVPLLRDGKVDGVFFIGRTEAGLFTKRQSELVQTFADQAVIAIENVRLFDEVQARTAELSESLQQQTATADVLKAISRSTFDLQPVLDTLVESAAKLCDADTSVIFKRDGDLYRWSANYGNLPEAAVFAKANPFAASRDSVTGRVALEARAVHVSDVLADPDYGATQLQKLGGYRTILCVPILREGAPVGVFALTRSQVRDFTPRQIELVETFADQSGIAIENVRLFDEVQARTRELSRSLEDLRTAQDRLVQTEKLASLGQLTAGIAHEIKNPLNFVNNFSALSGELIDDLSSVLAGAPLEAPVREEVAELTGMLKSNLDKVVQHGKRADSIVRNMLLHSRAGSGEHRPIDINAVVEESLNLAYHGARAEKPGFNVTLTRNFDPQAGDVDLYPQEITRVLLNLISNGFYAAAKRSAAANGAGYEPTLSATTRSLGDRVEIRIRDNGTGIPPEVKEKMFNPFFTTKPAGEGTGLGLSLSHDIVVKQHAGTIDVDSQPGEFTEFRIVLPRAAASLAKSGAEA